MSDRKRRPTRQRKGRQVAIRHLDKNHPKCECPSEVGGHASTTITQNKAEWKRGYQDGWHALPHPTGRAGMAYESGRVEGTVAREGSPLQVEIGGKQ